MTESEMQKHDGAIEHNFNIGLDLCLINISMMINMPSFHPSHGTKSNLIILNRNQKPVYLDPTNFLHRVLSSWTCLPVSSIFFKLQLLKNLDLF